MKEKKARHYVNNKDFYKALVDYQKICKDHQSKGRSLPQIPNYIGICLHMICTKLSLKYNFVRYTFLEEMVGFAIENCCAAVDNFSPQKSKNPFSYFTTIAYNAFIRKIEMESAQNYTKHINLENLFTISDEFYSELGASEYSMSGGRAEGSQVGPIKSDNEGLQRHYDVIRNFEAKQARKKEKNRQASLNKLKSGKPIISKKHAGGKPKG